MAEPMGFFTDTTVCIGCKACEVACKQWNQLPSTNGGLNTLSGDSYDNTRRLDGIHWRHVKFIEQFPESRKDGRWLLMSDVFIIDNHLLRVLIVLVDEVVVVLPVARAVGS
jgi:formate dehydrogenase iron-sulfur subunit